MRPKLVFIVPKGRVDRKAVLIDSEVGLSKYPIGFICCFPKVMQENTTFRTLFPENTLEKALEFLNEALEEYKDNPEIKADIEERIKRLTPKPLTKGKCRTCGVEFEYKKCFREKHYCDACKLNWYRNHTSRVKK